MTLDVVDSQNEKVGSLELSDEVFGGRVNTGVIWEAVVHQLACEHRGTHATKTRGRVSGSGKKPWRQKGTGRARVGEIRNPLWRGGGTVFGPQPRSYAYRLPKRVIRGGLRHALAQKFKEAAVIVVDALAVEEPRTRHAAELLGRLEVVGKTLLVDVKLNANLSLAVRNLKGVRISSTGGLSARDVMDGGRIIMTRAAIERLEQVLGS